MFNSEHKDSIPQNNVTQIKYTEAVLSYVQFPKIFSRIELRAPNSLAISFKLSTSDSLLSTSRNGSQRSSTGEALVLH